MLTSRIYQLFVKSVNLKGKIDKTLSERNCDFTSLAKEIKLPEQELVNRLESKTIDLRTLAKISKSLKLPLYSLLNEQEYKIESLEAPFCNDKGKKTKRLSH